MTAPMTQVPVPTATTTNILVHRYSHKSVHDVLAELPAIVAVDCVSQTDNHFKVINVDVPVWAIGKQTE